MRDNNIVLGAIAAFLAVGLGAFGAHYLAPILEENGRLNTWETAVHYHFIHSLAILLAGLMIHHFSNRNMQRAIYCFITGIALFSGSLYTLSLTNIGFFGAITPVGGVLFLLGWTLLAIGAQKK